MNQNQFDMTLIQDGLGDQGNNQEQINQEQRTVVNTDGLTDQQMSLLPINDIANMVNGKHTNKRGHFAEAVAQFKLKEDERNYSSQQEAIGKKVVEWETKSGHQCCQVTLGYVEGLTSQITSQQVDDKLKGLFEAQHEHALQTNIQGYAELADDERKVYEMIREVQVIVDINGNSIGVELCFQGSKDALIFAMFMCEHHVVFKANGFGLDKNITQDNEKMKWSNKFQDRQIKANKKWTEQAKNRKDLIKMRSGFRGHKRALNYD